MAWGEGYSVRKFFSVNDSPIPFCGQAVRPFVPVYTSIFLSGNFCCPAVDPKSCIIYCAQRSAVAYAGELIASGVIRR
jgi:hypothetical protein